MAEEPVPGYVMHWYTELDEEGGLKIRLPERLHGEPRVLRRLYHRLVDLMADYDRDNLLVEDIERWLTFLSTDVVGEYAVDLIRQAEKEAKAEVKAARKARATARAARKAKAEAPAKSKASTKSARKRKAPTKTARKTAKKTKTPARRRKEVARG